MWLEKFLKKLRAAKVRPYIQKGGVLLDIGCGPDAYLLNSAKKIIQKGIGIDRKIKTFSKENLEFINLKIDQTLPLASESADCITLLAVLEHLTQPHEILKECLRILKNRGKLIITTPTPAAQKLLNFLAYQLKVLSQEEIRGHVNYFSLTQLKNILEEAGLEVVKAQKFELGFNNLIVAQK